MKWLFAVLILLLLAGCQAPAIDLEPVTEEQEIEETLEETIEEVDTAPYYNFTEGDPQEILGRTITVNKIDEAPLVDLSVGAAELSFKETKSEEIIGGLRIFIQVLNYDAGNVAENYVTLKIEELVLGEGEYILKKGERQTIGNRDIQLKESRMDGTIEVYVYDSGAYTGEDGRIQRGETVELNGVLIKNLKNYYKVSQYAWIQVQAVQ